MKERIGGRGREGDKWQKGRRTGEKETNVDLRFAQHFAFELINNRYHFY